jgi:hypothetical protein
VDTRVGKKRLKIQFESTANKESPEVVGVCDVGSVVVASVVASVVVVVVFCVCGNVMLRKQNTNTTKPLNKKVRIQRRVIRSMSPIGGGRDELGGGKARHHAAVDSRNDRVGNRLFWTTSNAAHERSERNKMMMSETNAQIEQKRR